MWQTNRLAILRGTGTFAKSAGTGTRGLHKTHPTVLVLVSRITSTTTQRYVILSNSLNFWTVKEVNPSYL